MTEYRKLPHGNELLSVIESILWRSAIRYREITIP